MHTTEARLPKIKKTIIYLDQFAISNMMRALDPSVRSHSKVNAKWLETFQLLDVLVRAQVVVCPQSENHRRESEYSPFYPALKRLYDHLSGGLELLGSELIKRQQVTKAYKAWLSGQKPRFDLRRDHAFHGDVHGWMQRLRIVTRGTYSPLINERRKARSSGKRMLQMLFERWQSEKGRTFEERYKIELRAAREVYAQVHRGWLEVGRRVALGILPPSDHAPAEITTIHLLTEYSGRHFEGGGRAKVLEFFNLDQPLETPYTMISSALWASIAMKAAGGEKKLPDQGTFADLDAVATALPFCDAILIDNKCASLIQDIPAKYRPRYPTKIFCTRTLDGFLNYLQDLRNAISSEHVRMIEGVYGTGWDQPNIGVLRA